MKKYNRIMLGKAGLYADQCKKEGFIGAHRHPRHQQKQENNSCY